MSFEQRPLCKVCEARHFAREPHQFGGAKESTAARKDVLPISRTEPAASRLCPDAPRQIPLRAGNGSAKNRVGDEAASRELKVSNQAGTQAPPVDTKPKRGRPATGFDRKAYQREKARERRAKAKGVTT